MRHSMRRTAAALAAALLLVTHVGAQEAMSPSEDAWLAARAARNPELEKFTGGQAEGLAYGLAFVCFVAFSVAVGHVIGFPLGVAHSTQGKTFVPADSLKGNPGAVSYFNFCGAILGIPLYSLGYLFGLAVAPPATPAPRKAAPPTDPGRMEIFLLGLTEDGPDGNLRIAGVSAAADRAGLQTGDVILEIDETVVSRGNLGVVLARGEIRESLEVTVLRNGCRLRMAVSTKE